MSRYIDADEFLENNKEFADREIEHPRYQETVRELINEAPSIDIVRCEDCRKSHIDGKTTHHLWCTEWGRSTDTFGYCERGEREGE